ncbi:MAG: T9SS type A sorting domain-containing protein [Bacteroidales bacterium]|nr:T9SS type A sorting domain-containing protein [Bacteroidales bacterium]
MKQRILIILLGWLLPVSLVAQNTGHDWTVNSSAYDFNMTLIVQVQQNGELNPAFELGAFCAEECRGTAQAQFEIALDTYLWYLVIHGNYGDVIHFFVRKDGVELEAETLYNLVFTPNEMIGSPLNPEIIDFIFDEPTACVSYEEAQDMVAEVYSIDGHWVQTKRLNGFPITLDPIPVAGIYVVKITLGSGKVLTEKIVVK